MAPDNDCNGYVHVVVVFDGLAMIQIYLNGQFIGEQESTVTQSLTVSSETAEALAAFGPCCGSRWPSKASCLP